MVVRLTLPAILLAAMSLAPAGADDWTSLFNGKDLAGWTAKFTGRPPGENYRDTFRVEDGLLRVDYGAYAAFKGTFGHLFYNRPFGAYKLRLEYRFHGGQAKGGPGWAFRNSGLMVLAQAPGSMTIDQEFPVSIEFQFLGQVGKGERPSGSLCTPGTHVEMGGKLKTRHCIESNAATVPGDGWVQAEIHVLPGGHVRHFINGKEVLAYDAPQLDETDEDARRLIAAGHPRLLKEGYIALQAESHPVDFRKIEIQELAPD